MMAAKTLRRHLFQRTVRFVFFTGEEQGMLGSNAYANAAYASGDNIVGVLQFDMLGWDNSGGPVVRLHTRTASNPGHSADKVIADLFVDVVSGYGLSSSISALLTADGLSASDHSSFWNKNYPAILAIEDYPADSSPIHTVNDRLSSLNLGYYTSFVKAGIGTAALLANITTSTTMMTGKSI
jgi:Zn-dependent M28 family amino/carboxypeptidase